MTGPTNIRAPSGRWLRLGLRVGRLLLFPPRPTADLIRTSYDRIAPGYDEAWTRHMRGLTLQMLERLAPPAGAVCLDLTCGTGFVTRQLAEHTGRPATGVDASEGMIAMARAQQGPACRYVHAEALAYLRALPARSADIVTCAWGLGYTRPVAVLCEMARVLRPGGRIGVIDNSLFSLVEVLACSMRAFADQPESLVHVMRVRFLPGSGSMAALLRLAGLGVRWQADGAHTYRVTNGEAAIERLTATGAAAGFEFAARPEHRDEVFARFARMLEQRYSAAGGIPITHRYLAAIGEKR